MGNSVATEPLKRSGQETRYKGFVIRRKRVPKTLPQRDEFQAWVGFDTQAQAEQWVREGVEQGYLKKPNGLKPGEPKKP